MNSLISQNNKIIRWPKKLVQKHFVLDWLSKKFKKNNPYTENEVNDIINNHHSFNDRALLRRELISKKLLSRETDGSKYWK